VKIHCLSTLFLSAILLLPAFAYSDENKVNPVVILHTSKGDIHVELYADKSPITVENFLDYVRSGFYDGTIFHRVIRRFAVQGGGLNPDLVEKANDADPIINESKLNRLSNDRWTIAMARTEDPNSARSQFYFNMALNMDLDARMGRDGYAVFGKVIEGRNVVRDISVTPTHKVAGHSDVPKETVILINASIKKL
jgi:cyclophilin family peptidyl-prolyl cis-trans isomerase